MERPLIIIAHSYGGLVVAHVSLQPIDLASVNKDLEHHRIVR